VLTDEANGVEHHLLVGAWDGLWEELAAEIAEDDDTEEDPE
jgi:hypothetical protein